MKQLEFKTLACILSFELDFGYLKLVKCIILDCILTLILGIPNLSNLQIIFTSQFIKCERLKLAC